MIDQYKDMVVARATRRCPTVMFGSGDKSINIASMNKVCFDTLLIEQRETPVSIGQRDRIPEGTEVAPIVAFQFTNSSSAQVVINMLERIRISLEDKELLAQRQAE